MYERNKELEKKIAELERKIEELTSSKVKKKTKSDKPSWMATSDILGNCTATLLVQIANVFGRDLTSELPSAMIYDGGALINNIDREKAVRIYCTLSNLVLDNSSTVIIDNFLYDLIKDDEKILKSINTMVSSDGQRLLRYMSTGNNGSYAKKISCAIRRLDHL